MRVSFTRFIGWVRYSLRVIAEISTPSLSSLACRNQRRRGGRRVLEMAGVGAHARQQACPHVLRHLHAKPQNRLVCQQAAGRFAPADEIRLAESRVRRVVVDHHAETRRVKHSPLLPSSERSLTSTAIAVS